MATVPKDTLKKKKEEKYTYEINHSIYSQKLACMFLSDLYFLEDLL